jgi:hypothetical protein
VVRLLQLDPRLLDVVHQNAGLKRNFCCRKDLTR